VLLWSGGKDSALALHALRKTGEYAVAALLTTVTEEYDRISMHGVRRALLERQAVAVGLPLTQVRIPKNCSNAEYASRMASACEELKGMGLSTVASGDIFLEDVRRYREEQLAEAGMRGVFPLWGRDSAQLARAFVAAGFAAVTVCVDGQALDAEWWDGSTTRGSSPICHLASIPVGRTASSTRSCMTARSSGRALRGCVGTLCCGMTGSIIAICFLSNPTVGLWTASHESARTLSMARGNISCRLFAGMMRLTEPQQWIVANRLRFEPSILCHP